MITWCVGYRDTDHISEGVKTGGMSPEPPGLADVVTFPPGCWDDCTCGIKMLAASICGRTHKGYHTELIT